MLTDGGKTQELGTCEEFLQSFSRINGKAAAYVCRNLVGKLPVIEPEDLEQQQAGSGKEGQAVSQR
jgi:hypothetical protein